MRNLLFALALVHGLLYAVIIPPWQAPDEIAHYEYSRLLVDYRRVLGPDDSQVDLEQQIIASLYAFRAWSYLDLTPPEHVPARLADLPFFGRSRTLSRFSLAYVPYALVVMPFTHSDVAVQLYLMRFLSVLWGAWTVALAFKTARLLEPGSAGLATGAALFVLFLPQHAFITASVSDGNLAELLTSATIYQFVKMLRDGASPWRVSLSVICILAALLTKATAYFLVPLGIVTGIALLVRQSQAQPVALDSHRVWLTVLVAPLLSAIVLAGVLAAPATNYIQRTLASNLENLQHIGEYLVNLNRAGRFTQALVSTFQSFWLRLGWMALPLPQPWYGILSVVTCLAVVGLAMRFRAQFLPSNGPALYAVVGLAALLPLATVLGWFVASPNGLVYSQGRYLFAGIVPLAILFVRGWLNLIPKGDDRYGLWVILSGMMLLDTVVLFNLSIPFFYR